MLSKIKKSSSIAEKRRIVTGGYDLGKTTPHFLPRTTFNEVGPIKTRENLEELNDHEILRLSQTVDDFDQSEQGNAPVSGTKSKIPSPLPKVMKKSRT